MRRFSSSCLLGSLCLATLVAGCGKNQPSAPAQRPPAEVGYVVLKTESAVLQEDLAGRTVASLTSQVRPQVTGLVKAVKFKEGSLVKAGQVLYEVDDASYRAAVQQAKAALQNAQATVQSTRLKAERYEALRAIDGVAKQDADDARASHQQALAAVAQQQAALAAAQVNLDRTQVRAPISGRIGISSVTAGALVTASQTDALATIRTLDPMYVDLTQSSTALLRLRQLRAKGLQGGSAEVSLRLEDGSTYAHKGRLEFTEVAVDTATGSVTLRAKFPNPEGLLLPGMYVQALLEGAVDPNAILVPQQGIGRDPKGNATALLVNAEGKLEQRVVGTLRAVGDQWLISSGLAAGDKLVVEGLAKVKAGDTVKAVETTLKPAGR